MNRQWARERVSYSSKIYHLKQMVKQAKDKWGNPVTVQAWDEGELTSWESLRVPFRIVKMVRTTERTVIVGGKKQTQTEIMERWVGTTLEKPVAGTDTVSRIAAARWDIENMGFHDLKTYWHMDHPFVHHPIAIEAILGFLVLAVNLFYAFLFGHLHHFREKGTTVKNRYRQTQRA